MLSNLPLTYRITAMFISYAELQKEQAFAVFETLDEDSSANCKLFKQKCSELSSDIVISLRDTRSGNEGRTLLHNAARSGKLSAVLHLVRMGHAVEPTDSSVSRITPLMDAIASMQVEIAVVLIESGASLFTADVNDENALHFAARSGSTRMVKFLIKASGLSTEDIQSCASCTSIKLKFPEDVAANEQVRTMLVAFRERGAHGLQGCSSAKTSKKKKGKR